MIPADLWATREVCTRQDHGMSKPSACGQSLGWLSARRPDCCRTNGSIRSGERSDFSRRNREHQDRIQQHAQLYATAGMAAAAIARRPASPGLSNMHTRCTRACHLLFDASSPMMHNTLQAAGAAAVAATATARRTLLPPIPPARRRWTRSSRQTTPASTLTPTKTSPSRCAPLCACWTHRFGQVSLVRRIRMMRLCIWR